MQTIVEQLAVAQAREGFVVFVCAVGGAKDGYHYQNVERLQYIQFGLSGRNYASGLARMVRFLRQNQIQILHAHPGTLSRLAGILAGVPIMISTLHGSWPTSNWITRAVHRWLAGRTTRLVANSSFTRGYYTALLGLDESQCMTIYNGVDIRRYTCLDRQNRAAQRTSFRVPVDAKVVVSAGRLHPDKGVDILISAAAMIGTQVPNTHFLIVGDGECRRELEQQVMAAGIEAYVHFTGALADVRPALDAADIFVLPSARREGFGLALVEAMAIGLPVVGTNLGGIPEIVADGVNGLLATPEDAGSLTKAILRLLEAPELAARLAQNGQQTARARFSMERMIAEYETLYYSLLEKPDAGT